MFDKLLIANRGEIACRIMRTAQAHEIICVAIYSDADANAQHVLMADESYPLGDPTPQHSYLHIEKIIGIAKQANVDAIHPGYGFLSENPQFAAACAAANIVFIGPSIHCLEQMGSKSAAKRLMEQAQVPILPGYHALEQDPTILRNAAQRIGFPVLLKASAGGGGKGMRVVNNSSEFTTQLAAAKREALASFGDDDMIIEKYLAQPRHIELQIFADTHGNVVHLFERDCSIQRRHQKIIEEAPAPNLPAILRHEMAAAAIRAANTIGYTGAGTIEFLVDERQHFYFMEMNTRLQVEHPVTEMITQQDLVWWQLLVATGAPLPLSQTEIKVHGHALEVRLYAEDCAREFLPAPGTIRHLSWPAASDTCRIESGVRAGDAISIYYDPMIAKLIVHGDDRPQAIANCIHALQQVHVAGLITNRDFLLQILQHPSFSHDTVTTKFIQQHHDVLHPKPLSHAVAHTLAALAWLTEQLPTTSSWHSIPGWQMNLPTQVRCHFMLADNYLPVTLTALTASHWQCQVGEYPAVIAEQLPHESGLSVRTDEQFYQYYVYHDETQITLFTHQETFTCHLFDADAFYAKQEQARGSLTAPMPGKIVSVMVAIGTTVERGQALLVLEAMKMEHTIIAPTAGCVSEILFATGEQVREGEQLIRFAPQETS